MHRPGPDVRVLSSDSGITILLRSGETTAFQNSAFEGEQMQRWTYIRHLGPVPFHLLRVQYYESSGYAVIHDSTGRLSRIAGEPVFSPDGTGFVTFHHAWTAESGPSEITIWRFAKDSLALEYRWQQEDEYGWGPKEGSWRTLDTIQVVKAVRAEGEREFHEVPAYIVRERGKWVLHEARLKEDALPAD